MDALSTLNRTVTHCERCPRLVEYCHKIAQTKKREFRNDSYWGKPVPSFGDLDARLWIVGLAPAAHGANRTGRMFTGDSSGAWLYRALFETGFARSSASVSINDGQKLLSTYISAAVRCAPPDNKPSREELIRCSSYLEQELALLTGLRVILALGKIAHESIRKLLGEKLPPFGHNISSKCRGLWVLSSYHPSRQNTQTGRLTWDRWREIFLRVRELLKNHPA